MANKRITDVDEVSVINSTDSLFINQNGTLKQIKKSNIPKPTYTSDEVGALPNTTQIPSKISDVENDLNFISKNNTDEYTPTNNYNPATKKYVDDNKFSGSYNDLTDAPSSLPASDVYNWAKSETKPTYTYNEVGADQSGTATSKVSEHNTDTNSHNDVRLLIQDISERLNALADSDDTTLDQMSEIVAYIKNNKSLIDSITTSKINVSDIINNLTTNVSDRPLSAAQGVALKALIDAIIIPEKTSDLNNDSNFVSSSNLSSVATSGSYNDLSDVPDVLTKNGDSENNIVSFTCNDSTTNEEIVWNNVNALQSKETHKSIFNKISTMFKNIRYLYKILGTTDISNIGDGTLTNAIRNMDNSLEAIGKAKNLLNPTLSTTTVSGVTCTNNGDGTYTLNGTATDTIAFQITNTVTISAGTYKLVGCPSGGSYQSYKIDLLSGGFADVGNGAVKTFDTDTSEIFVINVASGTNCNNLVFKPMLTNNLGITYDNFVPYIGSQDTLIAEFAELNAEFAELNSNKFELVTNENGIAKKYNNGLVEQFGRSVCVNANNLVAQSNYSLPVPVIFNKTHSVVTSKNSMANSASSINAVSFGMLNSDGSQITIGLHDENGDCNKYTDDERTIAWYVIGFWK